MPEKHTAGQDHRNHDPWLEQWTEERVPGAHDRSIRLQHKADIITRTPNWSSRHQHKDKGHITVATDSSIMTQDWSSREQNKDTGMEQQTAVQ